MKDDVVTRLRRKKYVRTRWVEPVGEMEEIVSADMAEWDGVEAHLVNPDGPEAADEIERLRALLGEAGEQIELDRNSFRDCDIIDDPVGAAAVMESAMGNCNLALTRINKELGND